MKKGREGGREGESKKRTNIEENFFTLTRFKAVILFIKSTFISSSGLSFTCNQICRASEVDTAPSADHIFRPSMYRSYAELLRKFSARPTTRPRTVMTMGWTSTVEREVLWSVLWCRAVGRGGLGRPNNHVCLFCVVYVELGKVFANLHRDIFSEMNTMNVVQHEMRKMGIIS